MIPRRFYCDNLPTGTSGTSGTSGGSGGGASGGGGVTLDREQAEHARKSLRLAVGDQIELFDGSGTLALATITELHRTLVAVIDVLHVIPPLVPALTLAVAIPKGSRADTLIDQATQLGVTHLIPLVTTRSVVEPRDSKLDRFRRIVIEACKQSHRPHFMTLADPTALPDLLRGAGAHDLKLIADLPEAAAPPKAADLPKAAALQGDGTPPVQNLHAPAAWRATLPHAQRVLVLVGPEGGWTDDERAAAQSAGFAPIALGPHTLRIETAALAAAAVVRIDNC